MNISKNAELLRRECEKTAVQISVSVERGDDRPLPLSPVQHKP